MILLNYSCWIITSVILFIMLFAARDALFVDHRAGMTGYGVVHRVGSVANVSISRSSGMARFAAVPGVIAFVFFISRKGLKRFFWLAPFFGSCALVWFMQSRGAILALFFALSFIMLFFSMRIRLLGIVMMLLIGTTYWTGDLPEDYMIYVKQHFYRNQTNKQLRTLSGRTVSWKKALNKVKKSPFIGHGPQADRYLIKDHVHNTYYYALLEGGIIGALFFVGGLIMAWILFFRTVFQKGVDRLGQRHILMQVGGLLAFFTVRSIPEVCGAMFGVDLMVMLPALGYLQVLSRQVDHLKMSEAHPQV